MPNYTAAQKASAQKARETQLRLLCRCLNIPLTEKWAPMNRALEALSGIPNSTFTAVRVVSHNLTSEAIHEIEKQLPVRAELQGKLGTDFTQFDLDLLTNKGLKRFLAAHPALSELGSAPPDSYANSFTPVEVLPRRALPSLTPLLQEGFSVLVIVLPDGSEELLSFGRRLTFIGLTAVKSAGYLVTLNFDSNLAPKPEIVGFQPNEEAYLEQRELARKSFPGASIVLIRNVAGAIPLLAIPPRFGMPVVQDDASRVSACIELSF